MIGDGITVETLTGFVKANRRLVTYGSIAVGFILIAGLLTPFQVKRFFSINKKSRELKKKIQEAQQEINSKEAFLSGKEKIKNEILLLKERIITFQDISTLQADISAKAKENGLEIAEMMASMDSAIPKNTPHGNFSQLPIKILLKCTFHALGRFLNQIERGNYSLEVDKLSITGSKPHHDVRLEILTLIKE